MTLPALLSRVFCVISFSWKLQKLAHLELSVATLATYPTRVRVVLVTNQATALRSVVDTWAYPKTLKVTVLAANGSAPHYFHLMKENYKKNAKPYGMLFDHRAVMKVASVSPGGSTGHDVIAGAVQQRRP